MEKVLEERYRGVILDSSSSLKDFSMDRNKYYRKYVLGEEIEERDNQSITMGRVVETLLLEPHLFDERFYLSACVSEPTGLMLAFIEGLYKFTKESTDETGQVTRTFEEISRDAYAESGFKIAYDAVIKKFVGSDAEIYFNEIRTVRSRGLTVITANDVSMAEKIVAELQSNFVTSGIVNMVSTVDYTVLNQLQIENYEIDGHPLKSMIDKVIIDHVNKIVYIYDLKCVWAVEGFYDEYYLYRRAYIQAYLYYVAVKHYIKDKYEDYLVQYPVFIVCDSTNYYNPLLYILKSSDIADAYEGFDMKNRHYPGVKEIIRDTGLGYH